MKSNLKILCITSSISIENFIQICFVQCSFFYLDITSSLSYVGCLYLIVYLLLWALEIATCWQIWSQAGTIQDLNSKYINQQNLYKMNVRFSLIFFFVVFLLFIQFDSLCIRPRSLIFGLSLSNPCLIFMKYFTRNWFTKQSIHLCKSKLPSSNISSLKLNLLLLTLSLSFSPLSLFVEVSSISSSSLIFGVDASFLLL